VFLDECGVLTNMARRHGRSPRGQRARAKVPFGRWKRLSVLGAIAIEGFIAAMSVEAATDGTTFAAYLERVLLPELRRRKPDAVLVMDNLRAHKTPEVQAVLDRCGFAYRYLPSYSPDMNPIEPGWAKVKSDLHRAAARTVSALEQALSPALNSVTAQDAAGYLSGCETSFARSAIRRALVMSQGPARLEGLSLASAGLAVSLSVTTWSGVLASSTR
jgi:transposase